MEVPLEVEEVVRAWNMLGGELRWDAVETVAVLLGIGDLELLAHGLITIRAYWSERNAKVTN